jgi:uncharacterized membrane protein YhdT
MRTMILLACWAAPIWLSASTPSPYEGPQWLEAAALQAHIMVGLVEAHYPGLSDCQLHIADFVH